MTACQAMRDGAICGQEPARPYTCGPRCADCTPAVVAGRRDVEPPYEGSLADLLERRSGVTTLHETTEEA